MPKKALVAFGAVLGYGLMALSAPWSPAANAAEQAISRPAATAPIAAAVLTLEGALTRTLQQNPRLAALSREVEARAFEAQQAGRPPNPELSVEVENIAGSGNFSGTDRTETTVRISQLLELGDKRARRQEVGRLEQERARWAYETGRAEMLAETRNRFFAVLAAQRKLSLADEQLDLAERVLRTVQDRIAAGKTATIEGVRFQTLVVEARLRRDNARVAVDVARLSLAAAWGSDVIDFRLADIPFEQMNGVPPWEELLSALQQSPTVAAGKSGLRAADRSLALERANGIPDLTISLGAKNDQDTGDSALVAEFAIPIQLFARNQGATGAARARLAKARDEARSAHLQVRTALAEAWRQLQAAQDEVAMLSGEILPAAQKTFEAVTYGYQAGKFGFLEVLDAERNLFEIKNRRIDALTTYHRAVSELDRLLGAKAFQEKERGEA